MTTTSGLVLQARKLVKDYGGHKGIFGIDVRVGAGEIVGFIGPNGAGKSTTINVITGLIRPDQGTVKLFNQPVTQASAYQLMPRLGIVYGEPTIDENMSARRLFQRNALLMGVSCRANWQRLSRELALDTSVRISRLSVGNKKKVALVNAMMHEPQVLIMDEPTTGLDPLVRTSLMRLLEEFANLGGSVLLSSHDLSEVQQICHRIIMLKDGKVVVNDSTDELLERTIRRFRLIAPPAAAVEALATHGLPVIHEGGGELSLQTNQYQLVIHTLVAAGFYDFYVEHPSLAEAFAKEYR